MQPPDSYTATFEQQQAKQSNVMRGLIVVAPACGPQNVWNAGVVFYCPFVHKIITGWHELQNQFTPSSAVAQ